VSMLIRTKSQAGFSLVEIAIVLIVLGVLTRSAIGPLGAMIEQSHRKETAALLATVREALIGHVITTGVLPCPQPLAGAADISTSNTTTTGDNSPRCRQPQGGVPSNALGIVGRTDANGVLVDAWGQPVRYAVSLNSHASRGNAALPDWTTPGEPANVGIAELDADLQLCRVNASGDCPRREQRASAIVAVVLSTGADFSSDGPQIENQDEDAVFVSLPESRVAGHVFDDQLTWLSRSEVHYWMLRSHWLP